MGESFGNAVQVDFWENQRFKPLQGGWTSPYTGGLPSYSDVTGAATVNADILTNDDVSLPIGWKWVTEWIPDTSGVFGSADNDGWSYAGSFETLVKLSKSKLLRAARSTTNIARRRRWIRTRTCVSLDARASEKNRVDQLRIMMTSASRVNFSYQHVESQLSDHCDSWSESVTSVLAATQPTLAEVISRIEYLSFRLYQLRAFLADLGEVEAKYLAGLQLISQKWTNPNCGDRSALCSRHVCPSDVSFFHTVGTAQASVAAAKQGLVTLLQVHLPADVDQVLSSVTQLLSEAVEEGAKKRQEVQACLVVAGTEHGRCLQTLRRGQLRLNHAVAFLSDCLSRTGAGDNPYEHPFIMFNSYMQDVGETSDAWLSIHAYCQSVLSTHSALLRCYGLVQRLCTTLHALVERTATLLQSIMKALVHEDFKAFEAALEILHSCGETLDVLLINKNGEDATTAAKKRQLTSAIKVVKWDKSVQWSMWPGLLALCAAKQGMLRYFPVPNGDAETRNKSRMRINDGLETWRHGLVVITFDHFLQIVEDDGMEHGELATKRNFTAKVLLTADLRDVVIEPLFIAIGGQKDAFELQFAAPISLKTAPASSTSPSFSLASTSDAHGSWHNLGSIATAMGADTDGGAAPGSVAGLIFVGTSAADVASWLQIIAQPFS